MASSSAFGCQLRAGSAAVDLDLESDEEEQVLPCKRLKASPERKLAERGRDEPEAKTDVEPTAATRKAKGHAADKTLARWCALAPEKSLRGCELTIAALGATAGSRVQLRCGLVLLLRGDMPPMTAHEAVAAASALLRAGDPVAAAKALGHASPLTVDAMVQAHVRQVFQKDFQADLGDLNDRDRLRLQLRRTSALPIAFRVTSATTADLQKLQGQDFKDGTDFAAHPICKEKRLTASLGECHLLSGGLMSAEQAAADDTSRAPDCVVELSMEPPFTTSFTAFPPQAHGRAGGLVYSKVHAICPDGQHRAILLGLPADCIAEEIPSDKTVKAPLSQQLAFKCSLLRRTIERGRLFGGGAAAVQEALQAILDSREALATAAALRCLLLAMMDSVRLWKQRPEHVSFATLSMLAVLAASLPSWRPPAALRAALLRTASAAQAADQPESYMRWKTWRKPSGGGDDGRFDWTTGDDELADIRNSLRLLARGFLCLSAEEASMMSCYADAMVNRGGLPIYQLPLPRADLEERLPSDYHVAAVDCSVVPHLPLHLQAALRKPPLCESTNLKDLHLRNLRFFIEQTQFNIRHQKDLKLRGGYIAAGDMERIINYMDEEHFAAGRDLAEARALPDDSDLQKSNAEGFTSEEECHLQSDRCRHLRTTLESVQRFMLAESPKPATPTARRSGGKKSSLESVLVVNDGSSRLDGFLSLFGASREVKVAADRKDGQTLRVTCARTDRLDQPLLIQRAHRSQGQAGDRDEAFQEVDETSLREAAARAYCKSFADSKCSLPWPPMGFIWTVSGAVQLRAESGSAAEALRFFVAGVELPPFDAGPVLCRCRMPSNSQRLCDEDRALLSQALYIDCLDSRPGDQVKLLAQLRSVAETLRSSPAEDAAPEWLEEAVASKIPGCIWQEIYARLLLEEDFEGNPCLTLSPAHPYAGTLFRIVLLLAFLYPWVLAPSSNDLAFRITRSSDISGSLHQHLLTVVKTLAYSDAESRLSLAKPKALEAKVTTELFPYQKEAVERLLQSRHKGSNGSLDASSLGAGKTLVAVSFCMFLASAHGGGQFLVLVASSSLMEGWRDQLIQHTSGVRIQLQQENGVLRDVSQRGSNQATTSPGKTSPGKRKRSVQDTDTEALFVITTYARAARHPFCCTWLLVVADECLALQNTDTLQCTAAWRLVSRSLYGGHFISGTMFRRHYSDLLDMLKMLRSSIPLRAEFVQAYFGAYLISYMRPQRSWQTKLVPLDIPAAVQSSYLEVLDECRGRGAQNFVKVLSRMRRVLSTAVQNDARPLAEAVWQTVRQLRQEGRRPLVFASTEREADALVRHLGCARRYRRRHPVHCRGCDICRNFNKFAQPGCEKLPPVEGSEKGEELLIFTVGSDAAGLNLQSLGDSLILRPVQMDQLVQMMGRLDRPGQTSEQLCRAILYMKRTHEEAEVAHLQKHAAFWSLHIKPIARLIVMATAGAADNRQEVSERYDKLLEGEQKPKAAASLEIAEAPEGEAVANSEAWTSLENFGKRSWSTLRLAAEGPWPLSGPGLKSSPAKHSFSKLAFRQVRGDLPDSSPKLSTIDLEPPMDVEQQLPRAMTRQSVQLGVGYLIQNDERFRHVVQLIGPPTGILELLGKDRPDPFTTLVQTVCHQQLSVRVCQGMFERLLGLCGNRDTKVLQPERVAVESCDRIREVAKLSYRKIEYIQKIAHRFLDGTLSGEVFEEASDDELRHRLTELPGIGEWTLEMFLIFQLHRHGGIPYGDVAIQSAMKMIYNIVPPAHITAKNEVSWMPTRPQMEIFAKRWGPFGSIASLYMLRVADNVNAVFLPD